MASVAQGSPITNVNEQFFVVNQFIGQVSLAKTVRGYVFPCRCAVGSNFSSYLLSCLFTYTKGNGQTRGHFCIDGESLIRHFDNITAFSTASNVQLSRYDASSEHPFKLCGLNSERDPSGLLSNCSHGFQVHLAMALPQPLGASPGAAHRRGWELRLEQVSCNYCTR